MHVYLAGKVGKERRYIIPQMRTMALTAGGGLTSQGVLDPNHSSSLTWLAVRIHLPLQ